MESEAENREVERKYNVNKSTNVKSTRNHNLPAINKRIEKVINKSRGCKEHHKDCQHMKSTSCDELHFTSVEYLGNKEEVDMTETFIEHETAIELEILPCEKLFEKPFNSRLISNPVVYDSLKDYRLCGMPLC